MLIINLYESNIGQLQLIILINCEKNYEKKKIMPSTLLILRKIDTHS